MINEKIFKILLREGPGALFKRVGVRLGRRTRTDAAAQLNRIASSNLSNAEKFTLIYRDKLWLKVTSHLNRDKSVSGHGSTLQSTELIRPQLEKFIRDVDARTFLDAPCGDFNWMRAVSFPNECDYVGGDVVSPLIKSLQNRFGYSLGDVPHEGLPTARSRRFIVLDLTSDAIPKADIWLCKDCLQHLANSEIAKILEKFHVSDVEYFLCSNHFSVDMNIDTGTGGFRHVDITMPPFNFPAPFMKIVDAPVDGEPRYIGVWRRHDLTLG
jgi:hypothetical protein